MSGITKMMIYLWNMEKMDWFGYEVNNINQLSYHHIIKKEDGGLRSVSNGAILSQNIAHPYLHLIETRDFDMYVYLNNLLKNINNQREMPNKQQLLAIDSCLKMFEREHCSDRTKKGKLLIKEGYTKRVIK